MARTPPRASSERDRHEVVVARDRRRRRRRTIRRSRRAARAATPRTAPASRCRRRPPSGRCVRRPRACGRPAARRRSRARWRGTATPAWRGTRSRPSGRGPGPPRRGCRRRAGWRGPSTRRATARSPDASRAGLGDEHRIEPDRVHRAVDDVLLDLVERTRRRRWRTPAGRASGRRRRGRRRGSPPSRAGSGWRSRRRPAGPSTARIGGSVSRAADSCWRGPGATDGGLDGPEEEGDGARGRGPGSGRSRRRCGRAHGLHRPQRLRSSIEPRDCRAPVRPDRAGPCTSR